MRDVAQAVLALAAAGQAVPAVLVAELGRAVLRSEVVTLAQRAMEPGPFQLRAGIELARCLLTPKQVSPSSALPPSDGRAKSGHHR